jgi:hypothetical protein
MSLDLIKEETALVLEVRVLLLPLYTREKAKMNGTALTGIGCPGS